MSLRVVDRFEPVQVYHQHGNRAAVARGPREFVVQLFQNAGAVEQSGEAIVRSLFSERFARLQEFLLQVENPAPGANAHAQFVGIEGLGQIIVGAGVHAFDQILGFGPRGQQQYIYVGFAIGAADAAADLDAVHARHHPIEHRKTRGVGPLQDVPRLRAVAGDHSFVAPSGEHRLQHRLEDRVVLGCQHPHLAVGVAEGQQSGGVAARGLQNALLVNTNQPNFAGISIVRVLSTPFQRRVGAVRSAPKRKHHCKSFARNGGAGFSGRLAANHHKYQKLGAPPSESASLLKKSLASGVLFLGPRSEFGLRRAVPTSPARPR